MKNIAVLSSGTDNSGINAAIRAVVRSGSTYKTRVFGASWGFRGLYEGRFQCLTSRDVSGKIGKAGCFLGTGRPEGWVTPENMPQMLNTLKKNNISGIIVIGGKTSLKLSQKFVESGIQVIGIPSTIQDDIVGTDIALGVDSAVNNILKCVERIRSCDSSRDRTFVVQVEGKTCGSLALRSAVSCGADVVLVPEIPCNDLSIVSKQLMDANLRGKTQVITLISSGWKPGIDALTEYLSKHMDETDLLVRESVLGYVQRGGSPTGFDRLLGTRFGNEAMKAIHDGETGKMVALKDNEISLVSFSELFKEKPVDQNLINLFNSTR